MSRAQLIDEREDLEEADTLELEEPQEEITQEEDDLPEKYRGLSVKEVARMHQEAERMMGKHSQEVGELRKLVDSHIQAQLTQKAPEPQQEEDDVDFFLNPKEAVAKQIANHPQIKEAEEYTTQYKRQTAVSQLQGKHPDMQEILGDSNFAEWVKNSKIRTQLFVQADQQYDYEAADELFSLWKERQSVVKQTAEVEKQARKQQVKSASTGNARGSNEGSRKKVYRRADIIKLMRDDPERYQALSNEIMQAYQEGRVR